MYSHYGAFVHPPYVENDAERASAEAANVAEAPGGDRSHVFHGLQLSVLNEVDFWDEVHAGDVCPLLLANPFEGAVGVRAEGASRT